MQIYSFSPFGYEGSLVTVEVDLRRGIPAIDLVGLADGAVKEARERMQAAIRNSGFDFPPERILISLSPADLKKEGAGFDLPIALAVLGAKQESSETENPTNDSEPILIMGELELSGKVRPVRGVHAAASTAANGGILRCIVPSANANEAREVPGMKVFGADSLEEAFAALSNPEVLTERKSNAANKEDEIPENCEIEDGVVFQKITPELEFANITGQRKLIRALQIAAAGGHNLIAVGAPGCGKTLCLQKFPALLPALTAEEAQPVTRILSLAGLLSPKQSLVQIPPFRIPHQTATIEGICGGGPLCRPGEISLAHNGVLFLDEMVEFPRQVLEVLRQPLEDGEIVISRAKHSVKYPAKFMLLGAMNPCPCGFLGDKEKQCTCSDFQINRYLSKLSGPLLDRIDIQVDVPRLTPTELLATTEIEEDSATIRKRVIAARKIQAIRYKNDNILTNSELTSELIKKYCQLDSKSQELMKIAIVKYQLSGRRYDRVLKLARTIADLANSENIQQIHLMQALQYKMFNIENYTNK